MWLICSAISSELDSLRAFVASSRDEGDLTYGRIHRQQVLLAPLGIGSVDAAITLTSLIASHDFFHVWFVATAGALPNCPVPIGEATRVCDIILARAPGERLVSDEEPLKCLGDEEGFLTVWCSNGVSESDALVDQAQSCGAHTENLELWGVAKTCQRHELPFDAIVGISNFVGPHAHDEWEKNRGRAQSAACMMMADIIKNNQNDQ